jgi:ribosomal protein L44E
MEERTIKRLMASVKCSSCGQNYESRYVRILGHHLGLHFISAYCPSCQMQSLLAVTVGKEKVQALTDLTEEELSRFKKSGVLTADDFLDMHCFLKHFNGDFTQLFGRECVG